MKFKNWFERSDKGKEGEGEVSEKPKAEEGGETHVLSEKEKVDLIKGAESLDDLKQIIRRNRINLVGSSQSFDPDMLCWVIDMVKGGEWPLTKATSTAGFRDRIDELAKKEGFEILRSE